MLRSLKQGGDFNDEVVVVDENKRAHIKDTKAAIEKVIGELNDSELKLAALAEIVDDFLVNYKHQETSRDLVKAAIKKNIKVVGK